MKLWRPVGQNELAKIRATGMRAFPPRLPDQPLFYAVFGFDEAEEIARNRNSTRADHKFVGFVVCFELNDAYAVRFQPQQAGGKDLKELWVPASELTAFNDNIEGGIEIVAAYINGVRVQNAYAHGERCA